MILIYGECLGNAALALRTYRERYGNTRVCPTNGRTIVQAVQRIRENQSLIPHLDQAPPVRQTLLDEPVLNYFRRNPTSSLRRAARNFDVNHRTIHKVLKRGNRRPFKYKKVHALLFRDKPVREAFCRWILSKHLDNPNFLYNVMWTDESTFDQD